MNKTDKIRAIRDDPAASPGEKKAAEEMLRRISEAEKITNKISIMPVEYQSFLLLLVLCIMIIFYNVFF